MDPSIINDKKTAINLVNFVFFIKTFPPAKNFTLRVTCLRGVSLGGISFWGSVRTAAAREVWLSRRRSGPSVQSYEPIIRSRRSPRHEVDCRTEHPVHTEHPVPSKSNSQIHEPRSRNRTPSADFLPPCVVPYSKSLHDVSSTSRLPPIFSYKYNNITSDKSQ